MTPNRLYVATLAVLALTLPGAGYATTTATVPTGLIPPAASRTTIVGAQSGAVTSQAKPDAAGNTPAVKATNPAAPAISAAQPSPNAPTLGEWDDLAQREAYQTRLNKLEDAANKGQQATIPPLPPGPLPLTPLPGASQTAQKEAPKKARASAACADDDSPCFYAVYGMSVDGKSNNFRGLLAIDGIVIPVYKGKKFATRHGTYKVSSISTSELTAIDAKGKAHTWLFAGDADLEADPEQLQPPAQGAQRPGNLPIPFGTQLR